MIQAIVSDLDGTLIAHQHTIHTENVRAIREAQARGIRFALASGRTAAACSAIACMAGLSDVYIIGNNGCQVWDGPFGKPLALHPLSAEAAREAVRLFEKYPLDGCLVTDTRIAYARPTDFARITGEGEETLYDRLQREQGYETVVGWEAMRSTAGQTPLKMLCVVQKGHEAAFQEAKAAFAKIPGVTLTASWKDNFEVMPQGVNKGTAVREWAMKLGIPQADVMAFGDNENDLEMLAWAGHGVAMGNAQPEAKAAAAYETGHCHEAGVAQAIFAAMAEGEL